MKLSTFRRALEEAAIADEPVQIKGSLSDAFTESLNKEYKKPQDGEAVATESQANDAIAMQALARAISDEIAPKTDAPSATVFAVSATELTDSDIIALSQDMIDQASQDHPDYAVVLDTTTPETQAGTGDESVQIVELPPLAQAIESIAIAHGIPVFRSLEAYAIDRYIR